VIGSDPEATIAGFDVTELSSAPDRHLAPVGGATPYWPTPDAAPRARSASSLSVGLLIAIALIVLGIIGLGVFVYFATTQGNGQNGAIAPVYTATSQPAPTQPAPSPTTNPSPAPAAAIRINAGGQDAGNFAGDMDALGGALYATGDQITTDGVAGAAPEAVYQTERFGAFVYDIPGLQAKARYTVRLHFAEIYFKSPGQRKFAVAINGNQVLHEFDIVAAAGGPDIAYVRAFTTRATDQGHIIITFSNGSANYAAVNGIEIVPQG
jgi:hypothetical protein